MEETKKNETEFLLSEEESSVAVLDNNPTLTKIKSAYELVWFFLYRYLFSPSIIYIYIFPVSFLLVLSFLPLFFSGVVLFSTSFVFSVFVTYGITFYIIRGSTLYKNMENTGVDKSIIYFSIFTLIFITGTFILIYLILFVFILTQVGFVTDFFYPPVPPSTRYFGEAGILNVDSTLATINWFSFFYFFVISMIFTFIIAFLFQTISKTLKSFVLLSVAYTIISLFLCNEIFVTYAPILEGSFEGVDHVNSEFIVDPDSIYNIATFQDDGYIQIYPQRIAQYRGDDFYSSQAPTGLFGSDFSIFWWITLLFPSNFINIFAYPIFSDTSIKDTANVTLNGTQINGYGINFMYFKVNNPEWLFILIWPYILTFIYGSTAAFHSSNN